MLTVFPAPSSLGAEEEGGEDVTTTVDPSAPQPAEPDPAPEEIAIVQPWTARFLIPALVGTALLLIAGVTLYYFIRIKNRYRVVAD